MAELQFKTYRVSGNQEILVKCYKKLKLVPCTQSNCWKFNFIVTLLKRGKVMFKTHFKFSDLAPRAYLPFLN